MGCFDTVIFNCPNCGKEFEEQTKEGPCIMEYVHSSDVPVSIANGLSSTSCYHCGSQYEIRHNLPSTVECRLVPIDDEISEIGKEVIRKHKALLEKLAESDEQD